MKKEGEMRRVRMKRPWSSTEKMRIDERMREISTLSAKSIESVWA